LSIETSPPQSEDHPPQTSRNPKAELKAAKAYAKATRPWYKKKRWWASGLLLIIIAAAGGGAGSDNSKPTASANTSQASQSEKPAAPEKPAAEKKPEMTSGQRNALKAGQNYSTRCRSRRPASSSNCRLRQATATRRLTRPFAANHVNADWNKEAVEAAKNYLDTMPMSKGRADSAVVVFSG
jgi:hypothetical protein